MSGAAIAVEIAQADAASPYASALVHACTQGLRAGGECIVATDAEAEPSAAVAVVSWDGAHLSAQVRVGARGSPRSDWFTSQLRFAPWDAELERWRAVGLVIATLAAGASSSPVAPEAAPAARARTELNPLERVPVLPEAARPSRELAPFTFELGAHVARGAADGFGARGGSARMQARWLRSFFATASFRYEVEPRTGDLVDLEWGWISAGVGAATWVQDTPLLLEARLEPMFGRVQASFADGAGQGASSSGFLFGARQGVAATFWALDWLGFALDAELSETTRRTVLRASVAGGPMGPVAVVPQVGWSAGVGVRLGVR
jgi:hypothetical protein